MTKRPLNRRCLERSRRSLFADAFNLLTYQIRVVDSEFVCVRVCLCVWPPASEQTWREKTVLKGLTSYGLLERKKKKRKKEKKKKGRA